MKRGDRGCASDKAIVRVLLVFLLVAGSNMVLGQLEGERISAFVMGHSSWIWYNPFRILFMRDPLFTHSIYPLPPFIDIAAKSKLDRVYYPRTREHLVNGYDLMVFHDIRTAFTPRQVHDLDHAFREEGMNAFCGLCLGWDYAWEPTILREVLPVTEHGSVTPFFRGYQVQFFRDRDPVFTPFIELCIEKVVGDQYCTMEVKQGATIWGMIKPYEIPWMVSIRPGGRNAGLQWLQSHTFEGWWTEEENPYSMDVATNMIFYSLGIPLIDDIQARREARRLFTNLQSQKSIILSMMEWAESFGAQVTDLNDRLTDLEDDIDTATHAYLQQDYPETINLLGAVSEITRGISNDAVRLKDEALFWVYLSEWLVVTATAIVAGGVVWSLMVRRRMYRTPGSTRLSQF